MFSLKLSRTTLAAAFGAILLVPASQADDWGRDRDMQVDPAIAAAIHDRARLTAEPAVERPDDRAGVRGVGSLPEPEQTGADGSFDWTSVGVGAGAICALLLLSAASVLALRHGRARMTSA